MEAGLIELLMILLVPFCPLPFCPRAAECGKTVSLLYVLVTVGGIKGATALHEMERKATCSI